MIIKILTTLLLASVGGFIYLHTSTLKTTIEIQKNDISRLESNVIAANLAAKSNGDRLVKYASAYADALDRQIEAEKKHEKMVSELQTLQHADKDFKHWASTPLLNSAIDWLCRLANETNERQPSDGYSDPRCDINGAANNSNTTQQPNSVRPVTTDRQLPPSDYSR